MERKQLTVGTHMYISLEVAISEGNRVLERWQCVLRERASTATMSNGKHRPVVTLSLKKRGLAHSTQPYCTVGGQL